MNVIIHNCRGYKYLINTNNINSVELVPADPNRFAEDIAKNGGPLIRMFIDWYSGSSTNIMVSVEVAEEFMNLFEGAIELF